MNAQYTEEQQRVQEAAREFIESSGGIELARRRMEGDKSVIGEIWEGIADLDYTAITVPIEYNGFGEKMVFLTAILEEMGRYAVPGPLPETAAFAAPLINELGTEDQKQRYLPAIADGDLMFSFALYDDESESLPEAIQMKAELLNNGEYCLNGRKTLVPYGGEVDRMIVAARTRNTRGYDGISLFAIDPSNDNIETKELASLDRTRPMYEVKFDDLVLNRESLIGSKHNSGNALASANERFTVSICAMLVGAADRAVDLSTEYGNDREQYGQPIGRFQAVKHRIVDMWVDMKNAQALVQYAAWSIDNDEPTASRTVAATKTYAADRLHRVFGDDMWNHGGTGFTWDHDGHIYLKQAKAWRNFLGSPENQANRLIEARLSSLNN